MKRIALLGMPNTGKSTLFNRITGSSARVGNWPGITVDLTSAKILLGGNIVEVVDLPGIYDLHGFSDDEQVVRHFLAEYPIDLLLIVLNSSQLDHQLSLAIQARNLGLPCLLALNMQDESQRIGIRVDIDKMATTLGIPVVSVSAKYGQGSPELLTQATQLIANQSHTPPLSNVQAALAQDLSIEHQMNQVLTSAVSIPSEVDHKRTTQLDHWLLHPWLGLPIFFLTMLVLFQLIYTLGTPLQDGLGYVFDQIRSLVLEPALAWAPHWLNGLLLDGIYNGVSTVAAFVPIIVLFFLVMSLVEDSGYLSRAAFLMDALMAKLGLDGRSFVMVLMGFGCNVPALMGTRVMRSRGLRLLTMLIIPFSLCSARMQVFLFLTAILFAPSKAGLVLFSLYLMSFVTILITAWLFKGQYKSYEPFVMELPPYRLPTLQQIWKRGWLEVKHFLGRASKFIILGVILVWFLTNYPSGGATAGEHTFSAMIGHALAPILTPIGIDDKLAIALIFGFVAKEIVVGSLAVIYSLQGDALAQHIGQQLDWVQGMSFMLFTLIYTPCLSTIATLKNESKSWAFTLLSVGWSLLLAWLVSFAFYQSARALGF